LDDAGIDFADDEATGVEERAGDDGMDETADLDILEALKLGKEEIFEAGDDDEAAGTFDDEGIGVTDDNFGDEGGKVDWTALEGFRTDAGVDGLEGAADDRTLGFEDTGTADLIGLDEGIAAFEEAEGTAVNWSIEMTVPFLPEDTTGDEWGVTILLELGETVAAEE
jgi:hypothetical protein